MNSTLNILALDTATPETCACLYTGGELFTASLGANQRIRSTGITPMLSNLLQQGGLDWSALQLLAFSHGPGSFTGLRIGAATLAGINSAIHLPILHLSSLALTATQAGPSHQPLWVLEDARAGEAFVCCYQNGNPITEPRCMSWQQLEDERNGGHYCCQSEPPIKLATWQRLALQIKRPVALAMQLKQCSVTAEQFNALPIYPTPNYMQLSQAERNAHAT
ncbi:MAG: tRNA (adenosine(37)-N6)-threonylcarbamoyltransferase complex dimerization subunit type 1 TsaB [Mariprofundus sp.]|nr:tRNA (adenosine(37)-N6)-threonylcarbamoyltransferase complex dimerization subunit type 1 TsaB [Mariprofundus sp.]